MNLLMSAILNTAGVPPKAVQGGEPPSDGFALMMQALVGGSTATAATVPQAASAQGQAASQTSALKTPWINGVESADAEGAETGSTEAEGVIVAAAVGVTTGQVTQPTAQPTAQPEQGEAKGQATALVLSGKQATGAPVTAADQSAPSVNTDGEAPALAKAASQKPATVNPASGAPQTPINGIAIGDTAEPVAGQVTQASAQGPKGDLPLQSTQVGNTGHVAEGAQPAPVKHTGTGAPQAAPQTAPVADSPAPITEAVEDSDPTPARSTQLATPLTQTNRAPGTLEPTQPQTTSALTATAGLTADASDQRRGVVRGTTDNTIGEEPEALAKPLPTIDLADAADAPEEPRVSLFARPVKAETAQPDFLGDSGIRKAAVSPSAGPAITANDALSARPAEVAPLAQADLSTATATARPEVDAPKPVPKPFAEALVAQVKSVDVSQGRTVVNLHPKGLGTIEVEVIADKDMTSKVVVRVENPAVLMALRDERQLLADTIGVADSSVMEFQDSREENPSGGAGNQTGGGNGLAAGLETEERGTARHLDMIDDGRLDILT